MDIHEQDPCVPQTRFDRVRAALGERVEGVEEIAIVSETPYAALPKVAIARLADQKNVLVRVVLRSRQRALTAQDANVLREQIFAALHEGQVCGATHARHPG